LNEAMLAEPSVALYQARKELLRMVPIIDSMLEGCIRLFISHDLTGAKAIKNQDKMIDTLRRETVIYLSKVASHALSPTESRFQVALLFIAAELENLADVIERNIRDRAKKLVTRDLYLSEEGLEDVKSLADIVSDNFHTVMKAFENDDTTNARTVLAGADRCWDLQREFRRKHFRRLNEGMQVSIETTEIHMDLLNHLHRINRHIYHVAQTLIELEEPMAG
ncbi:MAG: PhoU domain-containing protein, partial [Spirochaetota bacterium]